MTDGAPSDDQLDELRSFRADGPWCLSVAVPSDESIAFVRTFVERTLAETNRIGSRPNRERITSVLERIDRILREYAELPANGLVIYGSVEGGDVITYVFDDLQRPVPRFAYRCDERFNLAPLTEDR